MIDLNNAKSTSVEFRYHSLEESVIVDRIFYLARALKRMMHQELEKLGTSEAEWEILEEISGHNGLLTQSNLASMLNVSKPTLGYHVDRLEAKYYVKRVSDSVDRRKKRLSLTKLGSQILFNICRCECDIERQVISGLSKEKINSIRDLLDVVSAREKRMGWGDLCS